MTHPSSCIAAASGVCYSGLRANWTADPSAAQDPPTEVSNNTFYKETGITPDARLAVYDIKIKPNSPLPYMLNGCFAYTIYQKCGAGA